MAFDLGDMLYERLVEGLECRGIVKRVLLKNMR